MNRALPHDPAGKDGPRGRLISALRGRLFRLWNDPGRTLPDNATTALLFAASRLYEFGLKWSQSRARKTRAALPAYVISIGNLVTGGTGKTPVTLFVCQALGEEGFYPAILSRGYGRKGEGPARVCAEGDARVQSDIFGDEPVLMASALPEVPVWVGRERVVSGRAALAGNGEVDTLVLDDGFQHLALDRNLDIVLVDSANPFGNGFTLPLGPLREPVSHLERADALIVTRAVDGPRLKKTLSLLDDLFPGKPVFACRHVIGGFRTSPGGPVLPAATFRGRRAVAFAGIAEPERFFDDLSQLGIQVCDAFAFPDHYRYTDSDLMRILDSASKCSPDMIVTTAKDAVKAPSSYREAISVAEMKIDFGADGHRFREFLGKRMGVSLKKRRIEGI
ncbi:MAG: tetraacyldisaccharide 4'-kinase [Syntrophobacter sp.]